MFNNGSSDNECPLCSNPYDDTITISSGSGWRDIFLPPHTTAAKYPMIHFDPEDVQKARRDLSVDITAYLHSTNTVLNSGASP